jgi:hypothetical protein
MSVTKDKRSPFWRYDFQVRGHRFFGSTKATTRREAEAVERTEREKAKQLVAQSQAARTSLRLDDVAGRYWNEIGQHTTGAADTHRALGYLINHFGKDNLLTEINGDGVARLVAWRRGHRNSKGEFLSPFTVNATTATLKKLFTRAKAWGVRFDHEPEWKRFRLKEPPERVRELVGDEAERLEAATRDDYQPFFAFAKASGLRFRSASCDGQKSIGRQSRSGSAARAISGSRCRSLQRSARYYGRCRVITPSMYSPSWRGAQIEALRLAANAIRSPSTM